MRSLSSGCHDGSMNRNEKMLALNVLRWVHVIGLLIVGFVLLGFLLDARVNASGTVMFLLLYAALALSPLIRHWLTLRWKLDDDE